MASIRNESSPSLSMANCGLLLSASFLTPSNSKKPVLSLGDHILSAARNCLRLIHSFASQNPLLSGALHFHQQFHTLCHQIRCSRNRNVKLLPSGGFAAVLPGDSVAGLVVANGIINFLNLYNTVLIVRLVLTWFPNAPSAIVAPLSTVCDPYLNIFRGLIPPLGGTLDLSPILAFLVLNAFTSTAAALPAELPTPTPLTASQKKWITRLHASNTSKSSTQLN